jgi:hypothetical protein|tara:strand:- start:499 stop:942 length:444 start_codon:yes stop_codon:yes gene_type:complete
MSNVTANKTVIRWYNGVEYTIAELFSMQNVVIEGRSLTEIIRHVLAHGSFNPTCTITNMPRFGLAIKLVHRGDDAAEYETTETTEITDGEEYHSAETMREIEKLERKLHHAEIRLFDYRQEGSLRRAHSTRAHIGFLERRIKALYAS